MSPRAGRSRPAAFRVGFVAFAAALALAAPIAAQEPPPPEPVPDTTAATVAPPRVEDAEPATQEPLGPRLPSPRTAFLRSLLVPGWGQATYGAHFRGGVYVAAQVGSGYMTFKTAARLRQARKIEARMVGIAEDSLWTAAETDSILAERLQDPRQLEAAVNADPRVESSRSLVRSRERQREDWITWILFWTLASGVDAFVAAHLAEFPAGVEVDAEPGGAMLLRFRVPVGRRP